MIKDKEIKFKLSTLLISLLVLGGIFCLFILSFTLFGGTVLSQFGWETTSNAIGFTGLIATAASIIFLYANFIQQQKQIDDQKRDVEYNRLIDLVYRQLDFSKRRFDKYLDKDNNCIFKVQLFKELFQYIPDIAKILRALALEIEVCYKFIEPSNISDQHKFSVMKLFLSNIDPIVIQYYSLYNSVKFADEYAIVNHITGATIDDAKQYERYIGFVRNKYDTENPNEHTKRFEYIYKHGVEFSQLNKDLEYIYDITTSFQLFLRPDGSVFLKDKSEWYINF